MNTHSWYERHFYSRTLTSFTFCLLPFSWIFRSIVSIRRFCYRNKIKKSHRFPVPIIVVGNITLGGTGKTPCVIWLTEFLRAHGYKPGIVSRGVGGKKQKIPQQVFLHSNVKEVGDEALLLVKRTQCPLVICINRVAAVKKLLAETDCDIIISDDGLQHYRLQRDIEILMIDPMRELGNQRLLPAGPLREPVKRLKEADFVICDMQVSGELLVSLKTAEKISLSQFPHKKIHAVAAIGNPQRFFNMLREKRFEIIEHIFPDHYLFQKEDLQFPDNLPIIMTEKDSVKCQEGYDERFWYIPVQAHFNEEFVKGLSAKLKFKF